MKNEIHMLQSTVDTICNSFLITTEDGKVIAIDGGYEKETDHFLDYLRKLTTQECPRIDAWFLTHPHDDHVNNFFEIMEHRPDAADVGTVYLNFPSKGFFEGAVGRDDSAAGTMEDFYRVLPRFADRMRILSGGDVLDIGAAHIRVLYSQDFAIKNCNNASLVFRMDLGHRSALFTGDCGVEAGEKILRLWGDSGILDCDICQMAHHGQNGCARSFYEAVKPEVCLWPTPSWLWTNNDGTGPYRTLEVRQWMDELGVKVNLVNKDGDQVISMD
ncbi:MAG: MBL fold metallo-hydrolase [Clostridia bacterium]|nr:MBL fold metallo-hydrolase [Clostridia bacterium]